MQVGENLLKTLDFFFMKDFFFKQQQQ